MVVRLVVLSSALSVSRRRSWLACGPCPLCLRGPLCSLSHPSPLAFPTSNSARVAAQIVTGVGFLGAGTILRFGFNIHGLTTAANIWSVAAIGLADGSGLCILYVVASRAYARHPPSPAPREVAPLTT